MLRDTHLIIDLNDLEHNLNSIKTYCDKNTLIGAVLKANAYGHGVKYIAKHLYTLGIRRFLVATLIEAIELKKHNASYDVMIMGHTPDNYLNEIVKYQIVPTLFSLEQAIQLNEHGKNVDQVIRIHLKIETGFNRLGLQITPQAPAIVKEINALSHIEIEGIFTHLALKDRSSDIKQIQTFQAFVKALERINIIIPIHHVCDSIGMVLYPEYHMNMVRIGALLYGLESEEKGVLDIKPIMRMVTKPSQKKFLEKGETISYGHRWQALENTQIATLPFGYADGYPRQLYEKGFVSVNNKKYPLAGIICMDQCMIDLGDDDISLDAEVEIIGPQIPVSQLANLAMTNKNDIVCSLSQRLPRVYTKNKQVIYLNNPLVGDHYDN